MIRRNAGLDFERFVSDSVDLLFQTAYLILWDEREAEDVVQESLFRIARRWPRVRALDHPRAYARRVVVNLALDGRARNDRRRRELDVASPCDVADESSTCDLSRVDARDELVCALAMLPPRQRAVVVLRYFADLPESEVADALHCSIGTVKSTASRALERLERTLRPILTQGAR